MIFPLFFKLILHKNLGFLSILVGFRWFFGCFPTRFLVVLQRFPGAAPSCLGLLGLRQAPAEVAGIEPSREKMAPLCSNLSFGLELPKNLLPSEDQIAMNRRGHVTAALHI